MGEKVPYTCNDAPNLQLRLKDGDPNNNTKDLVVQFRDKTLILDDEDDAEAVQLLDEAIENRPHIAQLVKKLDMRKALKIALEHKSQMAAQNGVVKGGVTATAMAQQGFVQNVDNLKVTMKAEGATDEEIANAIKDLEEGSGLTIAMIDGNPVSTPDDGVTPKPQDDPTVLQHADSLEKVKTEGPKPVIAANKPSFSLKPAVKK